MKNDPEIRFPGFTEPWEQRKLLDLLYQPVTDGPHETPNLVENGVPFISVDAIVDNKIDFSRVRGYITEDYDIECSKKYKPQLHDVYMVKSGSTTGKVAIVETTDRFNIWSPLAAMRCGDVTDPYFLYFLLQTDEIQNQVFDKASHGTQPNLSMRQLEKFDVVVPNSIDEQVHLGMFFKSLDHLIALHQRESEQLRVLKRGLSQKMFPQEGKLTPEIRFPGFTEPWGRRKLGDEFVRVNERNDGSFGKNHWISVAKMYFQEPEKVQSNNLDTRTYVMRLGDIAFEGHPNSEFQFGRFVVNDIGDGIISELFPIYRHKLPYENSYWKYAIQLERIMRPIYAKAITSSGTSSNKLNEEHFLRESILVPKLDEQRAIGVFFTGIDNLITLHQREHDKLNDLKRGLLQKMFV